MKKNIIMLCLGISIIIQNSCTGRYSEGLPFKDSKPYSRYWWFASMIKEEDVRYNLNWLRENGFGGVEIAWVYPLNRYNPKDSTYTPRQEWLSPEWTKIVDFTIRYADSIGLGCDLTFGTKWPFGDSKVPFEQATERFGDPGWRQTIFGSWEYPGNGYVIDHLTPSSYLPYFDRLMRAFPKPQTRIPRSYFIDSWEVSTEKLWSDGFAGDFYRRFGYDISAYMDSLYNHGNEAHLYDYMSLISEKVIAFYHNFDSTLNAAGVISRGQVSGAPCDLISGYSQLDIPEGESMLFEPEFCAIPASSAVLGGKKIVSSETFTCIYGWPSDYMRHEQTADLKLVADALFANGINQVVWHGKPHNPKGYDTVDFYATVHVGAEGNLSKDISRFNSYMQKVSSYMKKGVTYSDIAVYLPSEDAWRAGRMPKEKQFIWAWGYYEMRYLYFPDELSAYNPLWINSQYLEKSVVVNGRLKVGDAEFKGLYIDAEYLDYRVVKRLAELKDSGLTIILKKDPKEPGTMTHKDYSKMVSEIRSSGKTTMSMPGSIEPFLSGSRLPRHWCRKDGKTLYIFFPNPGADRLKFPIGYGQSLTTEVIKSDIEINYEGKRYADELVFEPYQSLLYRIDKGRLEKIDITFLPEIPVVRSRPEGYAAPWLVR